MMTLRSAPARQLDGLELYSANDDLFHNTPIFVFYGTSTITNATNNRSRVTAHIFASPRDIGFGSLTISPSAASYAAVQYLPLELQGDEIYRGLAFCISKYFGELPKELKDLTRSLLRDRESGCTTAHTPRYDILSAQHAGDLAGRMKRVENARQIALDLESAHKVRTRSYALVDLVLPPASMSTVLTASGQHMTYGPYRNLITALGTEVETSVKAVKLQLEISTPPLTAQTFSIEKKIQARREMCEFVDTEERYVAKLYDLNQNVAVDFRKKSRKSGFGSSASTVNDVFPDCLQNILVVNAAFLDSVRGVLDKTEDAAMEEMQSETSSSEIDYTGLMEFSNVLLRMFPRFSSCYSLYLAKNPASLQALNNLLRDTASSFSKRVHETGEQRLRSLLIEPVQRLPRYSLLIDSLLGKIPPHHPAVPNLQRARGIIVSICSLNSPLAGQAKGLDELSRLVEGWPSSLMPQQLISVAGAIEVGPPFVLDAASAQRAILLTFTTSMVLLRIERTCRLSAAEIRRLLSGENIDDEILRPNRDHCRRAYAFSFGGWTPLSSVDITYQGNVGQSIGGHSLAEILFVSIRGGIQDATSNPSRPLTSHGEMLGSNLLALYFTEVYQNRTSDWIHEVMISAAKADLEDQLPLGNWVVREIQGKPGNPTYILSVFEADRTQSQTSNKPRIAQRIPVDLAKHPEQSSGFLKEVGQVQLVTTGKGISVETLTLKGVRHARPDFAGLADCMSAQGIPRHFMLSLTNAVSLCLPFTVGESLEDSFIFNEHVLKAVQIGYEHDPSIPRTPSPVKIITQLLSGTGSVGRATPSKAQSFRIDNVPPMRSLQPRKSVEPRRSIPSIMQTPPSSGIGRVDDSEESLSPGQLEAILERYIKALASERGTHVSHVLTSRHVPSLEEVRTTRSELEDLSKPLSMELTPLPLLFAAFDTFIHLTWQQSMGKIVPTNMWANLLENSEVLRERDFIDFFRNCLTNLAPQNHRAFVAIVKLLSELLTAAENDGDKGALTAIFAGYLITDLDARLYISLLDHIVSNMKVLFSDAPPEQARADNVYRGSSSELKRARSFNIGPLITSTGSIRRKLGFGSLRRSNSKTIESKAGKLWRSLSKSDRDSVAEEYSDENGSSLSLPRSNLRRSISTDDGQPMGQKRPSSRGEGPYSPSKSHFGTPSSNHSRTPLDPILASPPTKEQLKTAEVLIARKKSRRFLSER